MYIDPTYRTDTRQLYYHEPKTNVSWLVQRPEYRIDGQALANAFMADWRQDRRLKTSEQN